MLHDCWARIPFLLVLPLAGSSSWRTGWSQALFRMGRFHLRLRRHLPPWSGRFAPLRAGAELHEVRDLPDPRTSLAAAIGTPKGLMSAPGLAARGLGANMVSVIFFLVPTCGEEERAHRPRAAGPARPGRPPRQSSRAAWSALPGGYSDYITYKTGRAVLWGGHSGSLDKFELVSPVWREQWRTRPASVACAT